MITDVVTTVVDNALRTVSENDQQIGADRWMNLEELCAYLPDKPAKQTNAV